jgi:hypothetical protein
MIWKLEIPSTKLQISANVQNTKIPNEKVLDLDIGIWILFGIWNLDIGIYRS